MNRAEKERYLRDYNILKSQGKPFFPYAVAKDSAMAVVVMIVIIVLAIVLGAQLGPKTDPTTTTYVPRPDWYFFFLFELLRVVKPPILTPLAMVGIPTLCMVLLFLLPFYDRNPERRIERRPIALSAGILTIVAMAFLTYSGATVGSPNEVDMEAPSGTSTAQREVFEAGKLVVGQSGCLACHKIGENGNDGPGPPLTHVADKLPAQAIASTLRNPTAPMPSFKSLPPDKFNALVGFLAQLK
jgi:quinol---cytochrome c reductase cytochrome c subunit, bacillus type